MDVTFDQLITSECSSMLMRQLHSRHILHDKNIYRPDFCLISCSINVFKKGGVDYRDSDFTVKSYKETFFGEIPYAFRQDIFVGMLGKISNFW